MTRFAHASVGDSSPLYQAGVVIVGSQPMRLAVNSARLYNDSLAVSSAAARGEAIGIP